MTRTLRFYFDYISHNAYLAWVALQPIAAAHALRVEPVPVVFAGLLNAHGQTGPAEIPAKLRWMTKDVMRKAHSLGLSLCPPASHPFNPLASLRATVAVRDPSDRARLVTRLFEATWCESRTVGELATVAALADEIGVCGKTLTRLAEDQAVKDELRANTDDAIAAGVFGVPTMTLEGELFWGYDDLPNLALYLNGDDPVAGERLEEWQGLTASAWRR